MTKAVAPLFLLLLLSPSFAQTKEDILFQKVFGKKRAAKDIEIPSYFDGQYIGDIKVRVVSDDLKEVYLDRIRKVLFNIITPEALSQFETRDKISVSELQKIGITLKYLPEEFKLISRIDAKIRQAEELSLENGKPIWADQALRAQNHATILNYDATYDISNNDNTSSTKFRLDLNPSYNYRATTLESFHYYESDDKKWKRSDTRIIWNEPQNSQAITIGDLNYNVIGYQSFRSMIGINWNKDFSLNPYKKITPDEKEVIFLDERSLVKIYINGRLIRASFFNAGKHILNNLPLETGLNDVRIEVKGNSGQEKVYNFTKSTSTELLAKNVNDYNLALGIPSDDSKEDKSYLTGEGITASLYYGRGIRENFTLKSYSQFDKKQYLIGSQGLFSNSLGIFSLSGAFSNVTEKKSNGFALKTDYEKTTNNSQEALNYRYIFGAEYLSKEFSSFGALNSANNISTQLSSGLNISFPSSSSLGLNISYGLARYDSLNDKLQFSSSFATRITRNLNINAFYLRERNEFQTWSTTIYAFLTYTIPDSNQYLSAYYDYPSETKRISWNKTNSEQINSLNSDISISDNNQESDAEAKFDYRSSLANVKLSHRHRRKDDHTQNDLTKINLRGSLLFSKKGLHIAPPVDGSFAIVSPNKYLKDQKIGVRSTSGFNEGENTLSKDIVITNLTPYNYRLLTLDTSNLTPGHTVKKEQIALYPRYKSGHIIEVGEPGQAVLAGVITNKGNLFKLKTGTLVNINTEETHYFFTGTKGQFLIEGVTSGSYELIMSGISEKYEIKITPDQSGKIDLGTITLTKK